MAWDGYFFPSINMDATSKRISQLIDESGLTDKELSRMMGLSVQSINKWRHGHNLPDIENLFILSRIFGVKVDDFFVPQIQGEEHVENSAASMLRRVCAYYVRLRKMRFMI